MEWHRSEAEVNKMIEEMKQRSKGRYITQGVSFNKTCPRQMNLLKQALMQSASFSGLAKELLALRFVNGSMGTGVEAPSYIFEVESPKTKNVGNFL